MELVGVQRAERGAVALRTQMRYLERNHDITRGSLDVLVNNTVGPNGIGIEFQPRRLDGSIHDQYARDLADAHAEWQRRPEVTLRRDWQNCERVIARTWYRDGESFAQRLSGPVAFLDHATRVPYSIELMEPDLVPNDYSDQGRGIIQGAEVNEWGRLRAWHVYKRHPGETIQLPALGDLKRIPAERMLQVRSAGMQGTSDFANLLSNVATRRLRAAYEQAGSTYALWASRAPNAADDSLASRAVSVASAARSL